MSRIEKFEDIEAWKLMRKLTKEIYSITQSGDFARDFGLRDQIRRAAVSVMSNIAEGYERNGNREFLQFLSQAKGSIGEIKAQLYVAMDVGFISNIDFERLFNDATKVDQLIGGLMKYLTESKLKGSKYKRGLMV